MKVLVVIRQLPGFSPVIHAVYTLENGDSVSEETQRKALEVTAQKEVLQFKNQFVEFCDAKIYMAFLEPHVVLKTEELMKLVTPIHEQGPIEVR